MRDFMIQDGCLNGYTGPGGDVAIPEGVTNISYFAFTRTNPITTLTIPASMERFAPGTMGLRQLTRYALAEGNRNFRCVDGVLYSADMTKLLSLPAAWGEEFAIPEGVTEIMLGAMNDCQIKRLSLPSTMETISASTFILEKLESVTVAEGNPHYKSAGGCLYDTTMTKLLWLPALEGAEITVPAGIAEIYMDSFCNWANKTFHIHMGPQIKLKRRWYGSEDFNRCLTIYAPEGSPGELFACEIRCRFVAEGEPVAVNDSHKRVERPFKEWRNYFTISARSKGLNISAHRRCSDIVYLPDKMGKSEVATIQQTAFLPHVTVLCSKRLFGKLQQANKDATIHTYLTQTELFLPEEREYLLAYLKKNRAAYLETYIKEEDYAALEGVFRTLPKVKTLMAECLELTARLGAEQVNFFLLQLGTEKA